MGLVIQRPGGCTKEGYRFAFQKASCLLEGCSGTGGAQRMVKGSDYEHLSCWPGGRTEATSSILGRLFQSILPLVLVSSSSTHKCRQAWER